MVNACKIGIDIIALARIDRSLSKHEKAFVQRVFTPGEIMLCDGKRKVEIVSGRFAAKEAVMKVLGCGWPQVSWTNIEILKDESGRPVVTLSGRASEIASSKGIAHIDVSITHDGGVAIAAAIGTA